MKNVISIAREYGYIHIDDQALIEETMLRNYRMSEVCIVCTGSQGESMAALSRIVNGDNKNTTIYPGDTVIFSSNPIPGNGALVDRLVNKLVKMGADVKQNSLAFSLHSSGHPSRQELRLMQRLVQPKYFMPVHGEYRMLKLHGEIATQLGMDPSHVFVCDNGDALQLFNHQITRFGHIPAEDVYIDGNDLDGLSSITMNDRSILKSDGLVTIVVNLNHNGTKTITNPIVYTRGFSSSESAHVVRHSLMRVNEALTECFDAHITNPAEMRSTIRGAVSKYIERRTGRKPMIITFLLNASKEY